MAPGGEQGVDHRLDGVKARVLQARSLRYREQRIVQISQRRAAPQSQRVSQDTARADRVPARKRGAPGRGEPLELQDVELVDSDAEEITGRPGSQSVSLAC